MLLVGSDVQSQPPLVASPKYSFHRVILLLQKLRLPLFFQLPLLQVFHLLSLSHLEYFFVVFRIDLLLLEFFLKVVETIDCIQLVLAQGASQIVLS